MELLILLVGAILAYLLISVAATGLGTVLGIISLVTHPVGRAPKPPKPERLVNGVPASQADDWDRMLDREQRQAAKIRKRYKYPV